MALTKVMAGEGGQHNILVNAMLVGLIVSDQWVKRHAATAPDTDFDAFAKTLAKGVPLGRMGTADFQIERGRRHLLMGRQCLDDDGLLALLDIGLLELEVGLEKTVLGMTVLGLFDDRGYLVVDALELSRQTIDRFLNLSLQVSDIVGVVGHRRIPAASTKTEFPRRL